MGEDDWRLDCEVFGELGWRERLENTGVPHDWRGRLESRFGGVSGELDRRMLLEHTRGSHDWRGRSESRFGGMFCELD